MHAEWRKSSFSTHQYDCVEVAYSAVARVRDSKNPEAGTLTLPSSSWHPKRLATITADTAASAL
ncbi:protein of unknown function [Actinokineospora alba]|uniref:DUF397 domain-containing protein n=1 Tax=Actinokineospora alba TaxID=504798 RepID=A0A1H0N8F0_9PSEU|nr:DUF397 domain-containing protein [Actinokineospora alba]TDP68604.1 uncharacterized protein DUF397 [Actinokineospora alba]SDH82669.1 protein of unknown function [Actinokineospora alba]SDO88610.1 protein of unknown function [Actinokineospora alba]